MNVRDKIKLLNQTHPHNVPAPPSENDTRMTGLEAAFYISAVLLMIAGILEITAMLLLFTRL